MRGICRMKLGLAGWALAAVLGLLLAFGFGQGDDATEERALRVAAEARADTLEAQRDSALAAYRDTTRALRDSAALEARAAQAARERAQVAESAAGQVATRLRAQLTAEQQAELDAVTGFYEEALVEEREASARLERQVALALAEVDAAEAMIRRETERADAWKGAYDAAEAEVEALRKPDLFSLGLDDVPKIALVAGGVWLLSR